MLKEDLMAELLEVQEFVGAIINLSEYDGPIECLAEAAEKKVSSLLANIQSSDFLLHCCKQHWLHGGKCE